MVDPSITLTVVLILLVSILFPTCLQATYLILLLLAGRRIWTSSPPALPFYLPLRVACVTCMPPLSEFTRHAKRQQQRGASPGSFSLAHVGQIERTGLP
ncbi:hypothetical protein FOFC_08128 [Fusarium oxysporum]|nr:hypothetical protein FOFC_08128 [Fusarium oxysporum]